MGKSRWGTRPLFHQYPHPSITVSAIAGQGALKFRKDINGLRAYAVMAVLLYHFGTAGVPGGYVGVDVFFVISGFLMTAIILPKLEAGNFSLSDFYFARARRILPALLFLCLSLLVFGWYWLPPHTYEEVGKNAGASILFISNFAYNRAGGYFATPAHDNWLLHTWSLSVEWQFYLLYPLLLISVIRLFKQSRRVVCAALTLALAASLIYCIFRTQSKPTSAFFMFPSRCWELLAGSLVYLFSERLTSMLARGMAELCGLAMILTSAVFYDGTTAWPGFHALLPVLGVSLIILAARSDSWWTCNPIAQALGRWSYSIYLWHWPLVVGLRYFEKMNGVLWLIMAGALSILLGALSYRYIEQTSARNMRGWRGKTRWRYAGLGVAVPFAFAAAVYFDSGIPRTIRIPQGAIIAESEKKRDDRLTECNTPESKCIFGEGKIRSVVWGDSHAVFMVNSVAQAAKLAHGSILFFGQQACPTIFNATSDNKSAPDFCKNFNEMVFSQIQQLDKSIPVVIINRYGGKVDPGERNLYFEGHLPASVEERRKVYFQNMIDSLCRIASTRPVYVVKPIPEMQMDVPATMAKSLITTGKQISPSISLTEHQKMNEAMLSVMEVAKNRCGIRLLDPLPYFCDTNRCYGSHNGRPLYYDDNHLSEYGNRQLVPMFKQVFENTNPSINKASVTN